jgi:hypothetical protein
MVGRAISLEDAYCINICKAKCCFWKGAACMNLTSDFKCSIHNKWINNVCNQSLDIAGDEVQTYPIEKIIASGFMDKKIMDQCCYAHPELLEKLNG